MNNYNLAIETMHLLEIRINHSALFSFKNACTDNYGSKIICI
jgi:hypothetical protein